MSGVERLDSWTIEPPVDADSYQHQVTMEAWADAYGVIPRLVPFAQRAHDPVEVLATISEYIDGIVPTAATFRLSQLADDLPQHPVHIPQCVPLLEILGSWDAAVNDNSNLERRWVNPNYVHLTSLEPNITDTDERERLLRRAAAYGLLQAKDIAPRFGVKGKSLRQWMERNGVPWRTLRVAGIGRIARTCYLVADWTDWSKADIARTLGLKPSTLRSWISRYARDSAFEIPPDPSGEPWFTHKSYEGGASQ